MRTCPGLRKFFFSLMAISLLAAAPVLAGLGGASERRCHCPCKLTCNGGGSCDCLTHSEDCHRCYCTDITVGSSEPTKMLTILTPNVPELKITTPSWFSHSAPLVLQAGIGATMSDTQQLEWYRIDLVRTSENPLTYAPNAEFNQEAYVAWKARVDIMGAGGLSAGYKSDPAAFSILDGNLPHLNEPLTVNHAFKHPNGNWIIVSSTSSTLISELVEYLESTIGGIPDEAFIPGVNPNLARGEIFSIVDTMDLLVKAGNFTGARGQVDNAIASLSSWLDPQHWSTGPTICAFRKVRRILNPSTPLECN